MKGEPVNVIKYVVSIVGLLACGMYLMPITGNEFSVSTEINAADTAWMLTASSLVLLMTPGLSFFYGGMVDPKNVISTMFQSFVAIGIVSILWMVVGFSLAFGDSIGGVIGDPRTFFMFKGVDLNSKA
jgi:Amt family ammonium transporter